MPLSSRLHRTSDKALYKASMMKLLFSVALIGVHGWGNRVTPCHHDRHHHLTSHVVEKKFHSNPLQASAMSSSSVEEADDKGNGEPPNTGVEKDKIQKEERFVYALVVEAPNTYKFSVRFDAIQGIFSSREQAIAAAGKARLSTGDTFEEAMAGDFQDDYEDYRVEKPQLDPLLALFAVDIDDLLIQVGNTGPSAYRGGEYHALYVKKFRLDSVDREY